MSVLFGRDRYCIWDDLGRLFLGDGTDGDKGNLNLKRFFKADKSKYMQLDSFQMISVTPQTLVKSKKYQNVTHPCHISKHV